MSIFEPPFQSVDSCDTETALDDGYPSDDLPVVEIPVREKSESATRDTAFTFITQMIGASLLSVPYIFARLGLALATVVMVIVLAISFTLMFQVITACYYTNSQTFKQVTQKVFNSKFAICIDAALILSNYGYMVSYVIISAQSFNTILTLYVLDANTTLSFDPFLVLKAGLTFGVMLPLSLLKNIRVLSLISRVGLGLVIITVFSVILYYVISFFRDGQTCLFQSTDYGPGLRPNPPVWPLPLKDHSNENSNILSANAMGAVFAFSYIPMLMGSFSIHASAPPVLYELHGIDRLRLQSIRKSMCYAYGFCFIMYLLMGYFGALLYGHDVSANILYSYRVCGKDIYLTIVGVAYALMVCIAYPLIQYPLKVSLISYCNIRPNRKCLIYLVYWAFSVAFALLVFTLSALYDNIASIFGLFGSICGVFTYFIVPILLWYKLPKLKARSPIIDRVNLLLQPEADIDDIRDATAIAFISAQHIQHNYLTSTDHGCSIDVPQDLSLELPSMSQRRYNEKSHFVSAAQHHISLTITPEDSEAVPLLTPLTNMKRNEMLQPIECLEIVDEQVELELIRQTEETRQKLLRKMTPTRKGAFYTILAISVCICAESLIINILDFASLL